MLIQDSNNKETVARVKKAMATFSNAHKMLKSQGRTDGFGGTSIADFNAFTSVLNVQKNCGIATGLGCFAPGVTYIHKDNTNWATIDDGGYNKAVLSGGIAFYVYGYNNGCTTDRGTGPLDSKVCGEITVDINGHQGPNQTSRDLFIFWYTKDGIYPWGSLYGTYDIASYCEDVNASGISCTAKVLIEDAINY